MDRKAIELFDAYTHGGMDRRAFLDRLAGLAGGTVAATALLSVLENDYAKAETVAEGDARLSTSDVDLGDGLKGYLAQPKTPAEHAVLVIHENRGLNPHTRDVARRVALAGYKTLALDYLSPQGGTPADPDQAREMIGRVTPEQAVASGRAAVKWLHGSSHPGRKVGAVGFCWGGGQVNRLAVADETLDAGVSYYGPVLPADQVPNLKAPLLLHYAGLDQRINAGVPAFEAALKAAGKPYALHMYEGVDHAFNNDTNAARFNKAAADLAWSRTLAFFKTHLA
jgi:carboxymethylenebutenolidase